MLCGCCVCCYGIHKWQSLSSSRSASCHCFTLITLLLTHTPKSSHTLSTHLSYTHTLFLLSSTPPLHPPLSRLYNDRINLFIKMTPLQAMLHDRIMARMSSGGSGLMRAFKYFGNTGGSNIDVKGFSHGCSMVGLLITPEERVR